MTMMLLNARASDATVCPSEVARALATGDDWRAAMPSVHAAVDCLLSEKLVEIRWKGQSLEDRAGPYRIGRARDWSVHSKLRLRPHS